VTPSGEVGVPFGRYRLFDKIGSGETADIYRAVALGAQGFERIVAVKRIRPEAEVADISKVFADKARLSALLEHRNIVQVYDFGAVDGNHFVAMEYLRGKNLDQVLRSLRASGQRLTPSLAVFIAREVALGLAHAHDYRDESGQRLGIVHRDVSPANIMLLQAGAVKLLDFGIARKPAPAVAGARPGSVRGKCHYLAPEQIAGSPVDARSDVFALGVVLWEMLTGRQLFGGTSDFAVTSAVTSGPIQAPSAIVPELPEALDRVLLTALARKPHERYASADRMAADLESVMSTLPSSRHGDLSSLLERVEAAGTPSIANPSGNAFARICGEVEAKATPSSVAGGFLAVFTSVAICVLLIATLSPAPEAAQAAGRVESASRTVAPVIPSAAIEPVAAIAAGTAVTSAMATRTESVAVVPSAAPSADGTAHTRPARAHAKKISRSEAGRRHKATPGPRFARRGPDRTVDPFGR
jgi:serine/threonine protein kinase